MITKKSPKTPTTAAEVAKSYETKANTGAANGFEAITDAQVIAGLAHIVSFYMCTVDPREIPDDDLREATQKAISWVVTVNHGRNWIA